uniref:Uncharacterized protein n=1 Tax=Spongospora subterranea TaxID=70186 RepID=A0A0H5QL43_9EUKA|eukprot:CRZ02322.1 hypothetical protein [Spongospora subterranea]
MIEGSFDAPSEDDLTAMFTKIGQDVGNRQESSSTDDKHYILYSQHVQHLHRFTTFFADSNEEAQSVANSFLAIIHERMLRHDNPQALRYFTLRDDGYDPGITSKQSQYTLLIILDTIVDPYLEISDWADIFTELNPHNSGSFSEMRPIQ